MGKNPEQEDQQVNKNKDKANEFAKTGAKHLRDAKEANQKAVEKHGEGSKDKKADGQLMMAEFEFSRALKIDEKHAKALHGQGSTHLEKGETEKAKEVFKKLISTDTLFHEENRSVLRNLETDIGKHKMFDLGLLKNGEIYVEETGAKEEEQDQIKYNHYRVKKEENDEYKIVPIYENLDPVSGEESTISASEFKERNFKLCKEVEHDCPCKEETLYKVQKKEADEHVERGEQYLNNAEEAVKDASETKEESVKEEKGNESKEEFQKAEESFNKALKFNEDLVRAKYGKGKVCLGKGNEAEAKVIFRELSATNATFEEENRHVFNELGIDLRKQNMFGDAIRMYNKAIEIDSEAPALYVNLARAYANKGNIQFTITNLEKAVREGEKIVEDGVHTHHEDFTKKDLEWVKKVYKNFEPLKEEAKEETKKKPESKDSRKTELDIDPAMYDYYFVISDKKKE